MSFWPSLIGYQAVWFAAVIGAGHGTAWPGVLGMLVYALAQLALARNIRVDLSLIAAALVLGFLLDGGMIRYGLASYASGWPNPQLAPAWILALWISFALTFSQSLHYLQTRLGLAALLGLIGGPLAYLGAARGWQVVSFTGPAWRGLLALAAGWALATPALAWLARRVSASSRTTTPSHPARGHAA
ncbi:DUF2878 domain-containing protein [Rhodanobacter denitrificans]|uniref:DUF2878 domain-containing protein n=1 Tax=Rhodanobacter denitrificans TaxID=666685 RepID=UPI000260E1A6|nr:DUF2878 domain-containing protein [Rhodanobacter denitrificans]EIM04010.1 hypothetical protein UUC_04399 [Rhodanobacter denitrificans]UJM90506.1 DUF2878 domain-containing protein [Rhodanobacter denitrificans]